MKAYLYEVQCPLTGQFEKQLSTYEREGDRTIEKGHFLTTPELEAKIRRTVEMARKRVSGRCESGKVVEWLDKHTPDEIVSSILGEGE